MIRTVGEGGHTSGGTPLCQLRYHDTDRRVHTGETAGLVEWSRREAAHGRGESRRSTRNRGTHSNHIDCSKGSSLLWKPAYRSRRTFVSVSRSTVTRSTHGRHTSVDGPGTGTRFGTLSGPGLGSRMDPFRFGRLTCPHVWCGVVHREFPGRGADEERWGGTDVSDGRVNTFGGRSPLSPVPSCADRPPVTV